MSYDPTLGVWLETDPAQYVEGPNLHQMERSNPIARVDSSGTESTTQPTTTQPTTEPAWENLVPKDDSTVLKLKNYTVSYGVSGRQARFRVAFMGLGIPIFRQTVEIVPAHCQEVSDALRKHERDDEHGGKDPFEGPVGDNRSGDPKASYPILPLNPRMLTDRPNFLDPSYPTNFEGTKIFVTTILAPDGTLVGTIQWSVSQRINGTVSMEVEPKDGD
jgi:hypothetical protein